MSSSHDHATATAEEAQQAIVDEFLACSDWEERYRKIIQAGRTIPSIEDFPGAYKDPRNIVKGCQSTVYMKPELDGGRVVYHATSDAMIVRGLIALLLRVYSGRAPEEVLATSPHFIQDLGLNENLTQGRANGLASMIEQIKLYAMAFQQVLKAQSASN